jgi:hypothetical protein
MVSKLEGMGNKAGKDGWKGWAANLEGWIAKLEGIGS